jgi:hypothetical protein
MGWALCPHAVPAFSIYTPGRPKVSSFGFHCPDVSTAFLHYTHSSIEVFLSITTGDFDLPAFSSPSHFPKPLPYSCCRSRRNSRSLSLRASPAVPAPRPPPLVLPEDAQRYSVYVPKEPKTLNPEDPQRYSLYIPEAPETLNPEESNLPTPATQGTISPYVGSGVGSPHEDLGIGKGQDTFSRSGEEGNRVSLLEDPANRFAPDADCLYVEPGSVERNPAPALGGQENGQVAGVIGGLSREEQHPPSGVVKVGKEENAGFGDSAAELPTVPSASPNSDVQKHPEGAASVRRTEVEKASVSDGGEASGRESIPRARRRSAAGGPKAPAGEGPQKGDGGETEPAFPRAESFDSVTQAARVRKQLRRDSELRNEKLAQNSRGGGDDGDEFLSADERSLAGRTASQMSALDAVWIESAREEGGGVPETERAGDRLGGAPAQEKPADVTADASTGSDEREAAGAELRGPNGRLLRAGSLAASPLPGGSGPGSPVNPGLLKLQQDYQQAQARLEQLLRMQQELEEQAAPPPLELGAGFGTAPSSTSLVVELSRSSRGEDPEGPKPASPPEAVDIDSPTWSRSSSPVLPPPPARVAESPAPPRKVHSILDSPGPSFSLRGRGLPRIGSSSRFSSPPRQPSPGFSSPYSSPERSSPLRRPWSLGGALAKAEKGLPPREAEEYQASGLSADTSRREEHYTNGGLEEARVPSPPPKPLPKPPPLPPPGSLVGFNKPPQAAPPPPPPPLRPGALSISAPSSSRGGVPKPGDLMQAIAQHDKGKLKRVEERGDPSAGVPAADSRNVMLEQIKQGVRSWDSSLRQKILYCSRLPSTVVSRVYLFVEKISK